MGMDYLTDQGIHDRVNQLNEWISEGMRYPNNYRNIRMISVLSTSLIIELLDERERMIDEIKELKTDRPENTVDYDYDKDNTDFLEIV
jgi:hypothetical protein